MHTIRDTACSSCFLLAVIVSWFSDQSKVEGTEQKLLKKRQPQLAWRLHGQHEDNCTLHRSFHWRFWPCLLRVGSGRSDQSPQNYLTQKLVEFLILEPQIGGQCGAKRSGCRIGSRVKRWREIGARWSMKVVSFNDVLVGLARSESKSCHWRSVWLAGWASSSNQQVEDPTRLSQKHASRHMAPKWC